MPHSFLAAGKIDETFTPEQVIVDAIDVVSKSMTVLSGQNLAALSVLGRVTASGKLVLCDSGASDGSQTPVAINIDPIDASAGDKVGPVYVAGSFNIDALTWHASFSTDALKLAAFGATNGVMVMRKLAYSAV